MSQLRDDRQDDLFRPPIEEIINFRHPLVRLAGQIDWDFLARRLWSAPPKADPHSRKTDLGIPCRSESAKVVLGGYS